MKKILIIDDSLTTRQLIELYLNEMKDVRLVFANNGLEAMVKLEKEQIDLILTDILMPFIDGFKLISFLKHQSNHKEIPIIIISQRGDKDATKQGLTLGANAYLVKPINKKTLVEKIKDLLASR